MAFGGALLSRGDRCAAWRSLPARLWIRARLKWPWEIPPISTARARPDGIGRFITAPPTIGSWTIRIHVRRQRGGNAQRPAGRIRAGVRRVVYTSTVGALGLNADASPADEQTRSVSPTWSGIISGASSWRARGQEWVSKGLPLVIVNPSTPVGEVDIKPTATGRMILILRQDSRVCGHGTKPGGRP